MNSPSVSFTGRLSLQDVINLFRYRSRCQVKPSVRWLIGVVSFLIAAMCLMVIVLGKGNPALSVIPILCAYFPVGWWYHALWASRRHYCRHPEVYLEHTVTIDEATVRTETINVGLWLSWNQIAVLLDTPKGLMFMLPQIHVLCSLPQWLFEGNNNKGIIVGYAIANKIPVRGMK